MTKICKRFECCTLDNYICGTDEQKRLVSALKDGIKNGFSKNIIIIGGVGTGKTHLAYALLNALAEKKVGVSEYRYYSEHNVIYRTIKDVIDNIHNSWNDQSVSDMDRFCRCPLMIIDEVGVQYGSDSERTELYTLFNNRWEDMLPIIAISNNKLSDLQKILGQRIYDRLTGGALIFELTGKSKRQE